MNGLSSANNCVSKLTQLCDEELIQLVADNDPNAFEVVFARHVDALFSLACRICTRKNLAEDIVQDASLSIWRSSASYDPDRGTVKTWMLGILHNRAVDAIRKNGSYEIHCENEERADNFLALDKQTEDRILDQEQGEELRQKLHMLPQEQRRVIELAYFDGLTQNEISNIINTPLGTVKGRMRLGLSKLHEQIYDTTIVDVS